MGTRSPRQAAVRRWPLPKLSGGLLHGEAGDTPCVEAGEYFGDGATGFGVDDNGVIRQGGGKEVAAAGGFFGGPAHGLGEGGQQEQAPCFKGGPPGAGNAHALQAARQADDDGLVAAQQDIQAILLDGGVEPADDRRALVA